MKLLTFMLGEMKYGVFIETVQSIEQKMEIVTVPNSLPYIKGIMNLHGQVIPVYSLAEKFCYENQNVENIIVADVNGVKIGFEVCKVEEILTVSDEHIQPMPQMIKDHQSYFCNVADNNKKLIVLLDLADLVSAEEQEEIREFAEQNR